nr:hypothetical protein [Tanacetum cinerariifolium]
MVESQGELLKSREEDIESLKARLLLREAKAAEAIRLHAEASNFETVENPFRMKRTLYESVTFVISSDSSHHSGTKVAEAEVDSLIRSSVPIVTVVTTITSTVDPTLVTKEKFVKP